jgi:hypothetical protein
MSSEAPGRVGRSVEERVALAMPGWLLRAATRVLLQLPPGSLVRRRMLKRVFIRGLAGSAREDHAFALLFYEPDVDLRVRGEVAGALGLAESYSGWAGYVQA